MSSIPGTRTRKTPIQRRAEIASAADQIARECGLLDVTLRAVAARAGITPALVAHYEPSMDALVAQTFAVAVQAEIDEVTALIGTTLGDVNQLSLLLQTLVDGSRTEVTVIWGDAWTLGRRNDLLAAQVRAGMDAWQGVIRAIIEHGLDAGTFETADAASASWQILAMIDGVNSQSVVRWGASADRSALIAHAVEGMLQLPRGALLGQPSQA